MRASARFVPYALAIAVAASTACAGKSDAPSSQGGNSSPDAGGTVDVGTGSSSTGNSAACAQLSSKASALLQASTATATLTCAQDSDCSFANNSSNCSSGCGELLNSAGSAALEAAIAQANAGVCATYSSDGCPSTFGGGPCTAPEFAACVGGTCQNFPPAAWTSFQMDEVAQATEGFSTPPSCSPGEGCSLWTLTPDGNVSVITPGGQHTAALSTGDFTIVDGVLRSQSFRQESMDGFTCSTPPGGTWVSFDITRAGSIALTGFDVSGCALVGPAGNGAQTVFNVLKTY